jgi:hypothetical protein
MKLACDLNLVKFYELGTCLWWRKHSTFPLFLSFKKKISPFSFGDACNAFINYDDDGGYEKIFLPFVSPNINDYVIYVVIQW